jgi:nitrate reductase gamma subunit
MKAGSWMFPFFPVGEKAMNLYLFSYLCLAVFVLAAVVRVYKQFTLPVHLRWELYPVKHEAGKRSEYGGSYMEESNWWEKRRRRSLLNEAKFMIPEILLLRGVWEENRRLWKVSFPFHFGLYMLIGIFILLVIGALGMRFGVQIVPGGGVGSFLYYLTILVGFVGLTLGTIGAAGLLFRRLSDPEMKKYSSFADYFNLVFLLSFFGVALLAWLFFDHAFDGSRGYIYSLLTFSGPTGESKSSLGWLTIVLASLLTAYIPLTHMSHMFMKYFMYHWVRWEDEPNSKGSRVEAAILKNLGFKPSWAAPHIAADGVKTWVDLATSEPKGKK